MMSEKRLIVMGEEKIYPKEAPLYEISKDYKSNFKSPIVLAYVNKNLRELHWIPSNNDEVEFLDLKTENGRKAYMRSLSFIFIRSVKEIYPNARVKIKHSLSQGLYCEVEGIEGRDGLREHDVVLIEEKMREIIERDEVFEKFSIKVDQESDYYDFPGGKRKNIFKYRESDTVNVYRCGWLEDYFYGYMVHTAGILNTFTLHFYKEGIVILGPDPQHPTVVSKFLHQPKLFGIYKESKDWAKIIGVDSVFSLNKVIEENHYPELVRISEARQEKRISQIADMISQDREKGRIVLIAGPSSSGKTSFAQRLSVQLLVNGLRPVSISLDDYFVDREKTPLDEDGNYDFESIDAIDLELFNEHLEKLISGYEVDIPVFNFQTGKREYKPGRTLKVHEDQTIIIEGIHGLNPRLTQSVPEGNKFRIYISALTQINLDDHNRIATTDLRLIRRIVRDNRFRGHDARKTISMWPSVRRGEEKNIFPFQENADVMFNSALIYELSVLKRYANHLLKDIEVGEVQYPEAKRLIKFLQYFIPLEDETDIPVVSLLREFVGGSRIV